LYGALLVQFVSTAFFVGSLWSEVLGLRTTAISYVWQEYIEVLASAGLLAGTVTTAFFVRKAQGNEVRLRRQIDVAAGNFQNHLMTLFDEWNLSPSESMVAVYAMKGFSNAEVAGFRGTSAATIKSQLNAVYRKSGFANRQQLISCLVEELLSGVCVEESED
jgi:DNA-binding CsgD family transcriptional regulator